MRRSIRTTCPYCGVGCGIAVTLDEDGAVEVRGDRDTQGFDETLARARWHAPSVGTVAEQCGLAADDVRRCGWTR